VNLEQYQAQQAVINALVAQYVAQFASYFLQPQLSLRKWLELLAGIFPAVKEWRGESAVLARQFYDTQRGDYNPELDRHDRELEGSDFPRFVRSMEPARRQMSAYNAGQNAMTRFQLQVIREVENAGRKQIIKAVHEDQAMHEKVVRAREPEPEPVNLDLLSRYWESQNRPAPPPEPTRAAATNWLPSGPRVVRGWARVATGLETCGWCLMLISRGPVYPSLDKAGLTDLTQAQAEEIYEMSAPDLDVYDAEVNKYMEEWHPGCDCLVVPVYDTEDWPGLAAHKRAEELYIQASNEARELREKEERVHRTGKNAGKEITLGEDTVLALRRMIARGDVNFRQLAFAA
jgi:hypothetical protein